MSLHRFETSQRLPMSLDEAWSFFSDPRNLAHITPPEMRFEIVTPAPSRIYAGLIVAYRVRPLGPLPVTWVTEITHVRKGSYFVDEQRVGPYRLWHHEHRLVPVAGGVEVRDVVHYALPLGPLGSLVNRLLVGPRVRAIFAYRRRVLTERFHARVADAPAAAGDRAAAAPASP